MERGIYEVTMDFASQEKYTTIHQFSKGDYLIIDINYKHSTFAFIAYDIGFGEVELGKIDSVNYDGSTYYWVTNLKSGLSASILLTKKRFSNRLRIVK